MGGRAISVIGAVVVRILAMARTAIYILFTPPAKETGDVAVLFAIIRAIVRMLILAITRMLIPAATGIVTMARAAVYGILSLF